MDMGVFRSHFRRVANNKGCRIISGALAYLGVGRVDADVPLRHRDYKAVPCPSASMVDVL